MYALPDAIVRSISSRLSGEEVVEVENEIAIFEKNFAARRTQPALTMGNEELTPGKWIVSRQENSSIEPELFSVSAYI